MRRCVTRVATRDGFTTRVVCFSAGNIGGGDNNGGDGMRMTILSPATAKNVITVGALEQQRDITNIVTDADGN